MTDDTRPIANPRIVLREEFDDWAILFDPDTADIFGLNPVCVFIWKLLDGNHTRRDIVGELRNGCRNVPDEVENHVKSFVEDLLSKGLAGLECKGA